MDRQGVVACLRLSINTASTLCQVWHLRQCLHTLYMCITLLGHARIIVFDMLY